MRIFLDLWWFFKRERKSYLLGISSLICLSFLHLFPPYAIQNVVDEIVAGTLTKEELIGWSVLCIVVGIVSYALGYFWRVQLFGAAHRLGQLLRNRLYEHFTKMSPRFFHQYRTGDLMAHATNDIQAIATTAGEGVLTLADSITVGTVVVLTMAVWIDWKLTLIALIPMPIMAYLTSYYGHLMNKRFHVAQEAFSDTNDKVQENISGIRVIKAFGQEEAEKKQFQKLLDEVVQKNIAVAKVESLFDPTIILCVGISFFLTVLFGSMAVIDGSMSIGKLTQFTLYLGHLIWPMLAFGWLFNIVERGRASYNRVRKLLQLKPEIVNQDATIDQIPTGEIHYHLPMFIYQIAILQPCNK